MAETSTTESEFTTDQREREATGAPRLRPLPRGVRGRRRLQALARQDGDRGRRPPVLPDHHEPPPAAHQRRLRRPSPSRAATSSSGPLVYSLALGMSVSDVSGKAIANLATEELSTRRRSSTATRCSSSPRCSRSKESRSKPDRGTVKVHTRVLNQDGMLVAEFKRLVLVPRKNPGEPLPAAEGDRRVADSGRHLRRP